MLLPYIIKSSGDLATDVHEQSLNKRIGFFVALNITHSCWYHGNCAAANTASVTTCCNALMTVHRPDNCQSTVAQECNAIHECHEPMCGVLCHWCWLQVTKVHKEFRPHCHHNTGQRRHFFFVPGLSHNFFLSWGRWYSWGLFVCLVIIVQTQPSNRLLITMSML